MVVLLGVEVRQPGQAVDVVRRGLDDAFQAVAGGEVDLGRVRVGVLQVVVGAEHTVVTGKVLGRFAPCPGQFDTGQGPLGARDRLDHLAGQLVLEIEHVAGGAVALERVGPDRAAVTAVVQLDVDADPLR